MIYNVTSDFSALNVTTGTVQNNSYIYPVEISNQAVADSGILLYPLNKFAFSGTQLFARCLEGGWAEIRVVPFLIDFAGTTSSSSDSDSDSAVDELIADALNGNYPTDPDADSVIDEMLNNTDPIDTGDGFSDFINDLFP